MAAVPKSRKSKGSKPPVTGQTRAEYLSNPHRGSYLPQTTIAEIVSLRKSGVSYRQIAERVGRNVDTVMRVLHLPETQREFEHDADKILSTYRARLLGLVPQAIESLEALIQARNPRVVVQLLQGTHSLVDRVERKIENVNMDPFGGHTKEERLFRALNGRWPTEEECRGEESGEPDRLRAIADEMERSAKQQGDKQ